MRWRSWQSVAPERSARSNRSTALAAIAAPASNPIPVFAELKILLSSPLTAPFVQHVAHALYEADLLDRYCTTFVDRPNAWWRRTACQVGACLGWDVATPLRRRAVDLIPLNCVADYPFWELIRVLASRLDRGQVVGDVLWELAENQFDRWVASQVRSQTQAVYGYEHACLATFKRAHELGLACVYELPAAEHDANANLLRGEIARFPALGTAYSKHTARLQTRRSQRRLAEWNLAHVVITNSTYTRRTYEQAGRDVSKVHVVPLGAPPIAPAGLEGGSHGQGPLRVLWVGSFSIIKGAHYLLSAWKTWAPKDAILDIYGRSLLPPAAVGEPSASMRFAGTVPHCELANVYRTADILVLPSLSDGFGQVVTEALSNGLPVIASQCVGSSDLISPGENGFLVQAGSSDDLVSALEWCATHRDKLATMRKAAMATAAGWQWTDYHKALVSNLQQGLQTAGYPL